MDRVKALAALLSLSVPAQAAEAAARGRIDLPAGRLADAAVALGRQAGISIGIRDPELADLRVAPVRGAGSAKAALRRLLAGSGARAVPLGPKIWLIVRAPPPRKRPVRRVEPRRAPSPPVSPPPTAAPEPPPPPPEIIVTGSKRSIRFAAYPGSAVVIDGSDLALGGLRGTDALADQLPSLTSTHLGTGRNKLFIRGIADSSFSGPTQATVGQYLGESRINYKAPDPDLRLHDIQRVELLSGPQGTLYGAGSLGGIIRIIPNPPRLDAAEGAVTAGASATEHGDPSADGAAVLNLPIAEDRLGLRLVGYGESQGGYIDDLQRGLDDVNRVRTVGGRAALRFETEGGWRLDAGLVGQRIRGEDAQFADRRAPPLTRRTGLQQNFGSDYALADLVLSKSWDDLRLVSAAAISEQKSAERYDSTRPGGPLVVFDQRNRATMFFAETRLSRERPDGDGWLIGASIMNNRARQERALGSPGTTRPTPGIVNEITEATLFGEGTVKLADRISLTAGARLSHSKVAGEVLELAVPTFFEADRSETALLPSIALLAQPNPDLTLYLRYQEGFRPGGLAVGSVSIQRFRNDRVAMVEGGVRLRRGGSFAASAAIAYTRWRDIQADTIDASGFPTTQNIGDGRIHTLDLSMDWRPVPALSFSAGASFNDSKVTDPLPTVVLASTSPLPNVARANARFGAEYQRRLGEEAELRIAASARYVGKSRLGIGPVFGQDQGDWLDTRLAVGVEFAEQTFSLTVSNLLDKVGNRFAFGSPYRLVEGWQITPLRPRTLRIGWERRF